MSYEEVVICFPGVALPLQTLLVLVSMGKCRKAKLPLVRFTLSLGGAPPVLPAVPPALLGTPPEPPLLPPALPTVPPALLPAIAVLPAVGPAPLVGAVPAPALPGLPALELPAAAGLLLAPLLHALLANHESMHSSAPARVDLRAWSNLALFMDRSNIGSTGALPAAFARANCSRGPVKATVTARCALRRRINTGYSRRAWHRPSTQQTKGNASQDRRQLCRISPVLEQRTSSVCLVRPECSRGSATELAVQPRLRLAVSIGLDQRRAPCDVRTHR